MCVVSNLGDQWGQTFPYRYPTIPTDSTIVITPGETVTREEFDALRKEVEELKILLLAAKRFDRETGQEDCEMDEKVRLIKEIAEAVGVDLEDLFDD